MGAASSGSTPVAHEAFLIEMTLLSADASNAFG